MGVCGSKAKGCVRVGKKEGESDGEIKSRTHHHNHGRKRRTRRIGRKSKTIDNNNNRFSSRNKIDLSNSIDHHRSYRNPAFQGISFMSS